MINSVVAKDKKTNDILYYAIEVEDEDNFMPCNVKFIVSPHFQPIKSETDRIVKIKGLEVKMIQKTIFIQEEAVYSHDIYGEMMIDDIKIIVDRYEKLSENEESDFENFISNLLCL